ncbi:MAG: anthranilate phosphoribosyltransferase [bacterium]
MENRLLPFMAKVGTGARGAKDLTYPEAFAAMNAILDRAYHPVTLGAFLLAERWKPESVEELSAFLDSMSMRLKRPEQNNPPAGLLDCAGSFDGKVRTLHVGLGASLVAAAGGAPMVMHGSENIPAKEGSTPFHVLRAMGIEASRGLLEILQNLNACHIAYLHQPLYNPPVHALLEERRQVGKRTFLNTIEPLANPLRAPIHIGGFFHREYGGRICEAIRGSHIGFKRVFMVMGIEGSEEIRPDRSYVAELREGDIHTYYIEPEALGFSIPRDAAEARIQDRQGITIESAERIQRVLKGEEQSGFRDLILVNAALRLYASGRVGSLEAGAQAAEEALKSGQAREILARWKERAPLKESGPVI